MAVVDPTRGALVIRIVYDGPPLAGKTTSLRALGTKLGGEVHSPQEVCGRTLYFDWLMYTGGLFEGRRICCQIISVPGQATLASRRRTLLSSADAVVFVSDTTHAALASTASYFRGAQAVLGAIAGPPIGIVVQANKRDHPDAAPLDTVRSELRVGRDALAVVEAIAIDGAGIRETFVFAVRLALDRVRELIRRDELPTRSPKVGSSQELLAELQQDEGDTLNLAVESGLAHTPLSDIVESSVGHAAFLAAVVSEEIAIPVETQGTLFPATDLPSGMIWPPVGGRSILNEVNSRQIAIKLADDGAWRGADAEWSVESPAGASFQDADAGRAALVSWAHSHSTCKSLLSSRRCIALANDGSGRYRLWQIVPAEDTLQSQLISAIAAGYVAATNSLVGAARALLQLAWGSVSVASRLPLRLSNVGGAGDSVRFVGLMPYPVVRVDRYTDYDVAEILRADIDRLFREDDLLRESVRARLRQQPATVSSEQEDLARQIVLRALRESLIRPI